MHHHPRLAGLTMGAALLALALAGPALNATGEASQQDSNRATDQVFTWPPAQAAEAKKPEEKKEAEKPFDEVVKDMEKIEGLFTFYRDKEENKVLLELRPDELNKDFLLSIKTEQATGERGLYGTIMADQLIFQWRRLGKRVQFVQKNIRFRAAPGSPAARAVEKSFSDSILSSGKLQSLPHPERKSVLIDLSDILLAGDLHGIGQFLKQVYKTGYQFDKDNSGFVLLKSFPRNSEIGTQVRFQGQEFPPGGSVTIPDPRSLNLRFRYSLVALPDNDYQPRLADDRVGHFMDMYMDFTSDKPETPYVRYINRWHLKKKDPNAALSEPVEPIVFWLENSVPLEYRQWLEEGVLVWNRGFEQAGFRNALVVKQQPDDADWDPADIRYNTVRWFTGYDAGFAIGPSHSNPYTGQILDADIGWSEVITRFTRREYEEAVDPVQRLARLKGEATGLAAVLGKRDPRYLCNYAEGLVEHAARGYDILATQADWSSEKEKEYLHQFVVHVIAHEVGHTLGLRHNFRASIVNRMDQLADRERTHRLGQAASVMDYSPAVVAVKGEKQGDYWTLVPGSYDEWAIEYAYKPVPAAKKPDDELPELARIAARVADPLLPYGTDEDAGYNPRALDPRNNHWDAADDPLAFFRHEIKSVNILWANMEGKLLKPGKGFQVLRRAMGYSWGPFFLGSHVAMKYIGGLYHNRDHVGDPNGRLPYVPVPPARQREALAFLAVEVWSPDVFKVQAELLNKLQIERFYDFEFSIFSTPRLDYPLHNQVLFVQSEVLNDLYHPVKLARLQDLELKYPDPNDRFTMADMFVGIRQALWSELDSGTAINSFRRNLQREHLRHLIQLLLKPQEGTPEDAVTLARADMVELQGKIERALASPQLDPTNRAHLEETRARIRQALEAQVQRGL